MRKALRARARALTRPRRPQSLVVDRPGFLQLDSQELRLGERTLFTFAAIDFFTRKRVVAASSRLTSAAGARFLERVQERFPFPVRAVQCDGGHEFRGEFERAAAAAGIAQFINRPNYPQGKGSRRAQLPHRRPGVPRGRGAVARPAANWTVSKSAQPIH